MMSHLPVAKKHFIEFRDDMNGVLAVTKNQSRGMLCPFQLTLISIVIASLPIERTVFDRTLKKRLGQKRLTPRNKKKFTKIAFQIFVNFSLFPKELLLLPPFIRV